MRYHERTAAFSAYLDVIWDDLMGISISTKRVVQARKRAFRAQGYQV